MKRWLYLISAILFILPCPADGEVFSAPEISAAPARSTHVYDKDGHTLRSFLSSKETYAQPVSLAEISPWVTLAALAAEDKRFYAHHGVDWVATLRAAWQNIRGQTVVSGASTITQQLARALHPRAKNWRGKWAEAWDALRLERQLNKDEILTRYLNTVELGNQTQGVQAAAEFYFGVSASELSLAQSALLVGLIQSPSRLNPLKNPSGAMSRRSRVLQAMLQNHFITAEQYQLAMTELLGISAGERPFSAPHYSRLIYRLAPHAPYVHTTLDKTLQEYAEKAVRYHLDKLTDQHVTNAAVVVLDNATGGVLAYVGSADFYDKKHAGQVDGAQAKRQPGSALKPFVYGLAMQNGLTAASVLADEDTFFEGGFRPRNYDGNFHGEVSLRKALANSYNIPVIKAAEPLGAARILQGLHEFDFRSLNRPPEFYGLGIALGGGEVTLLELANAYAALARGGVVRPVVFATQPRLQTSTKTARALAQDIAYILTDILADNAARADAFGLNSPLYFPFPAAAKTGTSKDYKDNFAIGYTPRLTVAVWAGNFDATPMQKVSGITGAAPILHDVLIFANEKYPSGDFVRPDDIVPARICTQSGLLAGANCSHTREEIFTTGTVPHAVCDGTHHAATQTLEIIFPVRADVYKYDEGLPADAQQLHVQTSGAQEPCEWRLNGAVLPGTAADFWWPLEKGKFHLSVSCGGQTADTSFTVL